MPAHPNGSASNKRSSPSALTEPPSKKPCPSHVPVYTARMTSSTPSVVESTSVVSSPSPSSPFPTPSRELPSITPTTNPACTGPRSRKARPALNLLSEMESRIAELACEDFKAYMGAAMPYPVGVDIAVMAKDSWGRAHKEVNPEPATPVSYSSDIRKIVSPFLFPF
jgi:hypothetical protein